MKSTIFYKDTRHSGDLFYFSFFFLLLSPSKQSRAPLEYPACVSYGGLNHHRILADSAAPIHLAPLQPCFLSGPAALTRGGLVPSWQGRATLCRVPTSTASRSPPTPTSSRTCWGACLLRRCPACPSAATAPRHQPVSPSALLLTCC